MSKKPTTLISICAVLLAAAAAVPASASFAGRNGLLVYTSLFRGSDQTRAIATMRPNGTHRRTLRSLPGATDPAWAPKGRRIAFAATSGAGGTNGDEIYTMNADGSDLRQVTHNDVADLAPSWGPAGGRIAFVRAAYDGDGNPVESSTELRIVSLGSGAEAGVVNAPMNDAAWAPDGTLIAYTHEEAAYVVPPSGGAPLKVAELDAGSYLSDLDWIGNGFYSAGGTVSFTQYGPSGGCDEGCSNGVWAVNHTDRYFHPEWGFSPTALAPERVTPWRGGSARHLVWAPSGKRAVFCAAGSGYPIPWDLHAMSWDGTHAHRVRRAPCPSDWQALPPTRH